MSIKKHIPNSLTLLNLLCGCLAIGSLFIGRSELIPYFIGISLLADFLDGLVARLLKVSSPIGAELDSLADMVSFGVLPGFLMVYLSCKAYVGSPEDFSFYNGLVSISNFKSALIIFFPLLITLFSALRLAKFNVDTEQSKEFKGLATPASTIFVIGLFMILKDNGSLIDFMLNPWLINLISLILALLLVSNIPMFSFKLGDFSFKNNKWQIIFLVSSVLLFAFFKFVSVPLIIVVYILLNLVRKLTP